MCDFKIAVASVLGIFGCALGLWTQLKLEWMLNNRPGVGEDHWHPAWERRVSWVGSAMWFLLIMFGLLWLFTIFDR